MPNINNCSVPFNENATRFTQQMHASIQHPRGNKIHAGPCAHRPSVFNHQLQFARNDILSPGMECSATQYCAINTGSTYRSHFFQRILKKSTDELDELITQKNHAQQNLVNSQQRVDQLKNQLSYWRGYLINLSMELPTNNIFLTCLENESLPIEISDCFLRRKQQQIEAEEINLSHDRKRYFDRVFQLTQKKDDHQRLIRQIHNTHR